jgi:hypothetical protein
MALSCLNSLFCFTYSFRYLIFYCLWYRINKQVLDCTFFSTLLVILNDGVYGAACEASDVTDRDSGRLPLHSH